MLLKARHPILHVWRYFIDKCLPFGSSVSCAQFQSFSDALAAIFEARMGFKVTNYLDDFLFVADSEQVCNYLLNSFITICDQINCPTAEDKTAQARPNTVFLGVLLDGEHRLMAIPQDKKTKVVNILKFVIEQRKVTIKLIQKLTGLLNFLHRVIVPGRTFTRQLYDTLKLRDNKGNLLKHYHHVKVDDKVKQDCTVWLRFLTYSSTCPSQLCRPFIDLNAMIYVQTLSFYTDAAKSPLRGFGCVFGNKWIFGQWPENFIQDQDPSIEFLELYALCVGILSWENLLENMRIVIFCNNQAVVNMVNNLTSK